MDLLGRHAGEPMAKVDTAWLRMETPTNLMMITGLIVFDEPVDYERLRATLETRLVGQFRRFVQAQGLVTLAEQRGLLHADLRVGANVAGASPLKTTIGGGTRSCSRWRTRCS